MEYLSAKEAAEKWGISNRMVNYYCVAGRIEGAVKKGNLWLIPYESETPADERRKEVAAKMPDESALCRDIHAIYEERKSNNLWPFESLYENKELFAEIFKHFPYPMHIYSANGTMLLANDAFLEFAKISDPERLYKKHSILLDPDLERWGVKDFVLRAYRGEVVHAYDVKVPQQEIFGRLGDRKDLANGRMYQNMTAFPIRDENGQLQYIVTVFITSRYYKDREEIAKGKEYIENHWKEEFSIEALAEIVHMSRYHYARLFKQHTGLTPYSYYQDVKISKLKEKLCDTNLSVAQAFAACGTDYNRGFSKLFKEKTGMTPTQFRRKMT